MRLRIFLLALGSCLLLTETSQAQWGRGGGFGYGYGRGGIGLGGGWGSPYSGYPLGGLNTPGYYGYGGTYNQTGAFYGPSNYNYGLGSSYYGPTSSYYGPSSSYYGPTSSYYGPTSSYYGPGSYVPPSTYVVPASLNVNAPSGQRIAEVFDGAAQKGSLRAGDIITSVGSSKIRTFEDLQQALAAATGEVEIAYLSGATMKPEKTKVTPKAGKLGVSVVTVYLP